MSPRPIALAEDAIAFAGAFTGTALVLHFAERIVAGLALCRVQGGCPWL